MQSLHKRPHSGKQGECAATQTCPYRQTVPQIKRNQPLPQTDRNQLFQHAPTLFDILDFIVNFSLLNDQRREEDPGIPTCAGNDVARPNFLSTESGTTILRRVYD